MPPLKHCRYLTARINTLHFRKATEQCSVSQPALSGQLRELEERLGVQLVERSRRSQVLLTHLARQSTSEHASPFAASRISSTSASMVGNGWMDDQAPGATDTRSAFASACPPGAASEPLRSCDAVGLIRVLQQLKKQNLAIKRQLHQIVKTDYQRFEAILQKISR